MDFIHTTANGKLDLIDKLLNCKMNAEQYMNNEPLLKNLTELIDRVGGKTNTGYALIGIEHEYKSNIMLIVVNEKDKFTLFTWSKKETIEKPLAFNVYAEDYVNDTMELINNAKSNTPLSNEEVVSLMLTQGLTGYSLNQNKIKEYIEFSQSGKDASEVRVATELTNELSNLAKYLRQTNKKEILDIYNKINKFAKTLDCSNLKLVIDSGGLLTDNLIVGKITDVRQVGNKRHFKIEYIKSRQGKKTKVGSHVANSYPERYNNLKINKLGEIYIADGRRRYYNDPDDFDLENFTEIPYNYIDEGRYLVAVRRHSNNDWKIIISGDPRVDSEYVNTLNNVIDRYCKHCISKDLSLDGSGIVDNNSTYSFAIYASKLKSELTPKEIQEKGIRLYMQALKKMVSEYKYIDKKHKSIGKDVFITDKVAYNHETGTISYGDFNIGCDDELMKSKMYEAFERYLVQFYRGNITEESILNGLLDTFFSYLKDRLTQVSGQGFETKITINNITTVNLKVSKTARGSNLVYLNNLRFNKNEVLVVLREITCYRDQAEAERFIRNVGKLGLSVYIGITTGFEVTIDNKPKIYRFKKEDGRSKYKLILDDLEIDVKGKKLISILYNNFIGDLAGDLQEKIQKAIFSSVGCSLDYLKYKFLIDSSYESFKEKSRKFLDKKVQDVNGEYCTYLPEKKKKPLEAVKVTGTSGKVYCVAFDNKDSFVFMDPQKKDNNEYYSDGKYICMVDQSNIKSNIGYDTVISKLMSLKNDSLIAGTIYNLEEELSNG